MVVAQIATINWIPWVDGSWVLYMVNIMCIFIIKVKSVHLNFADQYFGLYLVLQVAVITMDGNLLVGSFPLFAEDDKSSSHSSTTFNRHHRRQHQTRNSEFKPNSDVSRMALEPKKTVVAGDG